MSPLKTSGDRVNADPEDDLDPWPDPMVTAITALTAILVGALLVILYLASSLNLW
ncbi:putative protein OS=Tsukamurella paurometabola (strain ATCC 8368 / DSM / CCUG 35730 /CIP 100753 / JCM 10117 / KCTC 9821 / NBRC 16120 / NCIMB 702349/ NCTC 13040) OX=521096 GN=Tpau_0592 PE=4 SV=1 [Tsukamurella paurometabola]|uniref:Uncharacterized protein n=1 Tax=Tsukamurella paurometabola (strain ATCC 8368 / DSM 20162 / CCUG 35730 / CIP 100753 / JCM 10117 / KCTC 9821 / NBRC 16120 / NCIMB 702349 / NCTC 13040) TaxID=521096 RepID=D5USU3_TSUPD|nr:hypothetical protein [Tsukamurella paurometabola]ADG77230.1 hypothetical protein Tpau_0592 [Tsukamurella paurometabola DSM 20162]SUP43227.1 Uncharacterised protein [Tsukamurella paurometabola]